MINEYKLLTEEVYRGKYVFLLHDMKGISFVVLHKGRDNFIVNSTAMSEIRRSKQFVKWKITIFVLIAILGSGILFQL